MPPVSEEPSEPGGPRSGFYSWYLTIVLMLTYALSFIDRKLPFILAESIKRDLHLSDTQIGLMTGLAFTLVYAVAGLPIAKLADRGPRKWIIVVAVGLWSAMTALGGFAQNFFQLALSRTGVAIGESACTPAGHSILGDRFSTKNRGLALAVYMVGSPLGILLGLWLGGLVADLASWRVAMFAVGAPGLALALLVAFTVREPKRRPLAEARTPTTIVSALKLFASSPTLRHMLIAGALVTTASGASNAFGPAYMIRTFGLSTSQTGLFMGVLSGVAGLVGAVAGGVFGDYLRKRDPREALWLVGGCLALGGPFLVLAFSAKTLVGFLALMFMPLATSMVYAGPCYATIQSLVPERMRSLATAVYLFALNGVGLSLGPLLAGLISDGLRWATGRESLGLALMIIAVGKIWGGLHYIYSGIKLPRAISIPAPNP